MIHDDRTEKTHAFVGAGMDGIATLYMFAHHYIDQYRNGADLHSANVYLIDKNGVYGPGYPYNLDNDNCLLNQPSDEMSPFKDKPRHYTHWLAERGIHTDFVSRKLYGAYGTDLLHSLQRDLNGSNIPFHIQKLQLAITDVDRHGDEVVLSDTHDRVRIVADQVVLATGHQKSPFLADLDGQENYLSGVFSKASTQTAVRNANHTGNTLIVGSGQSAMDALSLLDSVDYKGQIYAVSGHGIEPWAYYPEHYRRDKKLYQMKYLTTACLDAHKTQPTAFFLDAFQQEIAYAKSGACNGTFYDIGYVLNNINFAYLHEVTYDNPHLAGLQEFRDIMVKYYGNPTAPEKHKLWGRYKDSGQLKLLPGRINRNDITCHDGAYTVQGVLPHPIKADILINAASISRNPFDNPLLKAARDKNMLDISRGRIKPGRQYQSGLSIIGPAVSEDKYGIRSFCLHTFDVAQNLQQSQRRHRL